MTTTTRGVFAFGSSRSWRASAICQRHAGNRHAGYAQRNKAWCTRKNARARPGFAAYLLASNIGRCFAISANRAAAAIALLALGAILPGIAANAEDTSQVLEQKVKAAFLFKFGGYVEWPESAFSSKDAPIVIGVAGADALAEELSQVVAGRTMNGRPVTIRRIPSGELPLSLHVLFIGRSEVGRLNEVSSQGRPVLTVTDIDRGLAQGSIINFIVVDRRVRFEIALDTAKRNGLRIGAPLLSVAMRVKE